MNTQIPTITIEYISPELAAQYLTKNVKNRPKKAGRIARYARDMVAGRWEATGEGIKFDINGNLADGQNRLHAIILAGVPVAIVVVRGVTLSAMSVMDSGAPRSNADTLCLNGFANGKDLAAAINVHSTWTAGEFPHAMASPRGAALSNAEALAHIAEFPELTDSTSESGRVKRVLRLPIGAIATAHHQLVRIDPDKALDFFDRIHELRTLGKGDPIATLIKRVADDAFRRTATRPATGLFYLFRAWNAFAAGEELTKFQLGSDDKGWTAIPAPIMPH